MRTQQTDWLIVPAAVTTLAFTALSLLIAGHGMGRLAAMLGHSAELGYWVAPIFELAKAIMPIWILALWRIRAFSRIVPIGLAWLLIVIFSAFSTHATIALALSSSERSGAWKMESRSGTKAELASVEQQVALIAQKAPRLTRVVRDELAAAHVPPVVWKESRECDAFRDSAAFAKACSHVIELRQELALAESRDKLLTRATDLRRKLADLPIVATADPLAAAFEATVGRYLNLSGSDGIAILLTAIVEIISCCGLASCAALRNPVRGKNGTEAPQGVEGMTSLHKARSLSSLPDPRDASGPQRGTKGTVDQGMLVSAVPSPSQPWIKRRTSLPLPANDASLEQTNVAAFANVRLLVDPRASLSAAEIRQNYEAWCAEGGFFPLPPQKFGVELGRLGFSDRWKSCGRIRYRGVRLAVSPTLKAA